MANHKHTALRQIVDDLNIKNAATIPAPLTVEQCALSNPIAVVDGGNPFINTEATLTIIEPDENYSGQMTVRYKRLDVADVYQAVSHDVVFIGPTAQSKTRAEMTAVLDSVIKMGLTQEITNGTDAIELTRVAQVVTIQLPSTALKLKGSINLNVRTDGISLGGYTQLTLWPFITGGGDFPLSGIDPVQLILDEIELRNGVTYPLNKVNFSFGPANPVIGSGATIEVTNVDDLNYVGSGVFTYIKSSGPSVFEETVGEPLYAFPISEAYTRTEQALAFITDAIGAYYVESDFSEHFDLPPVRELLNVSVYPKAESYVYQHNQPFTFQYQTSQLFPLESIVQMVIGVEEDQPILFTNYHQGTVPVTLEVIDSPVEFVGTALPVTFTGAIARPTNPMPPGTYVVKATAADSYPVDVDQVQFSWGDQSATGEISPITEVIKHTAWSAFRAFAGNLENLTTIQPGALDEATYLVDADEMFFGCSSLEEIPAGLFDNAKHLSYFSAVFHNCTSLTAIPDYLFGGMRSFSVGKVNRKSYDTDGGYGIFGNTSVETVPNHVFYDMEHAINAKGLFAKMPLLTSVSANVLSGINITRDNIATIMTGLFYKSGLETIPDTLFNNVFQSFTDQITAINISNNSNLPLIDAFNGTAITEVPLALFSQPPVADVIVEGLFSNTPITSLPVGLFDLIKLNSNLNRLFKNCTLLTSVPNTLFKILNSWTTINMNQMFMDSGLTVLPTQLFFQTPGQVTAAYAFKNTTITGSGLDFIQNHNVTEAFSENVFEGCVNLTDYATLPAWAK